LFVLEFYLITDTQLKLIFYEVQSYPETRNMMEAIAIEKTVLLLSGQLRFRNTNPDLSTNPISYIGYSYGQ
jgi:hypothetical protein